MTFGGSNYSDLYVTTAGGNDPAENAEHAGAPFSGEDWDSWRGGILFETRDHAAELADGQACIAPV